MVSGLALSTEAQAVMKAFQPPSLGLSRLVRLFASPDGLHFAKYLLGDVGDEESDRRLPRVARSLHLDLKEEVWHMLQERVERVCGLVPIGRDGVWSSRSVRLGAHFVDEFRARVALTSLTRQLIIDDLRE